MCKYINSFYIMLTQLNQETTQCLGLFIILIHIHFIKLFKEFIKYVVF